jgi:predicted DNA binding CopG/RHH family protein
MKKSIKINNLKDPLAGDLSGVLGTLQFKKARFSVAAKDTTITLRMPASLVDSAKALAKHKGVKYQHMMRDAIVDFVVHEGS